VNDVANLYNEVRAETAALLNFDLNELTLVQSLRLEKVTMLRVEVDAIQARQAEGNAINVDQLTTVIDELEKMLPQDKVEWDLTTLSDDELKILERIGRKATGDDTVADVAQALRIESLPRLM
jgi:hypothetical protein